MSEGSLAKKVRTAYAQDAAFARSHRMVTWMMAFWAFTVIVDRGIGMLTNAYEQTSAVFPLAGAAILLLIAFLGTQGHLTLALLFLELNMAVFLIQFAASCFFYKETAGLWGVIFYGIAAAGLIVISLMLFLNRDIEAYREKLNTLNGKADKKPLFYRTNSRLIKNTKK